MTTATDILSAKSEANEFLNGLSYFLKEKIPCRAEVAAEIQKMAKKQGKGEKEVPYENYFLRLFVIENLFKYVVLKVGQERARGSMACESYEHFPEISASTPASLLKSPFKKVLGASTRSTVKKWWDLSKPPVAEACPDISLQSPHKIVFEAKYFRYGEIGAAKTVLVSSIYQCFFYRGLPKWQGNKTRAAWDYDYACLLAYDATEKHSLSRAWDALHKDVKKGCWDGSNIYVMLLPGV